MKSLETMMLALIGTGGAWLGLAPDTARAGDVNIVIITSDGGSDRCGGYDRVVYHPRHDCRGDGRYLSHHRGRTWGDGDYRKRSGRIGGFVEARHKVRHVRRHRIVHRKRVVTIGPSRMHHGRSYATARRHNRQAGRFLSRW